MRAWFPFLVKPVRRVVLIFVLLLIIEYLVVPELVGASKDLYLLGRVNAAWLVVYLLAAHRFAVHWFAVRHGAALAGASTHESGLPPIIASYRLWRTTAVWR